MGLVRAGWMVAGLVAVGLGFLGVFLPLLPTVPFMLLGAFCFARSSPALHDWLVEHPRFGGPIRDWQRDRAISPKAKRAALAVMAGAFLLSLAAGVPGRILLIQAVVLLGAGTFVATRPDPRE